MEKKVQYNNLTSMYHVFEGNNLYSRQLYSEEEARAAFATLKDCKNCTNCEYCVSCDKCTNCVGCKDCVDGNNGKNLVGQKHFGYLDKNDTLLTF